MLRGLLAAVSTALHVTPTPLLCALVVLVCSVFGTPKAGGVQTAVSMAPSVMTIGCFGGACTGNTNLAANLTFAPLDSAPTWMSGLPLLGREPATSLPYALLLPGALAAGLTSTLDHSSWTQRGGLGLCITRAPPPAHLSSQPLRSEGVCPVRRLVFAVNSTQTPTKTGINTQACRVIAPLLPAAKDSCPLTLTHEPKPPVDVHLSTPAQPAAICTILAPLLPTCPTDGQPVKHRLSPMTATPCSWACSPSQELNKTTTASPAAALPHTSCHLAQASGITALLSVIAGVACVAVCFQILLRSALRQPAGNALAPEHTNPSDPTSTSPSHTADEAETAQSIAGSPPSTTAPAAELAPTTAAPWAIGSTQTKRLMFQKAQARASRARSTRLARKNIELTTWAGVVALPAMMQVTNLADRLLAERDATKKQVVAAQGQLLAERQCSAESTSTWTSTGKRASASLHAATKAIRFLSSERAATAAQLLVAQERAAGAEEARQQAELERAATSAQLQEERTRAAAAEAQLQEQQLISASLAQQLRGEQEAVSRLTDRLAHAELERAATSAQLQEERTRAAAAEAQLQEQQLISASLAQQLWGEQEAVSRLTDRLALAEHEAVSSIVDELLLDVEQAAGPVLPDHIESLHAAPASSAASPFAGLGAGSSSSGTNASSPLLKVVVQHEAEQLQAEPAAAAAVPLAARAHSLPLLDVSSGDSMARMHRWSSSSSGLADTNLPVLSSAGGGSISISTGSPGEGLRGFSSSPSSNNLSSGAMTMAAAAAAAAPSATGHVADKVWRRAGSFWGSMRTKVQQRLSSGGSSSSGSNRGSSSSGSNGSAPAGLQLLVSDAASFDAAPTTPGGSAAAGTVRDQQPQLQPSTEAAAPAASAAAHTVLAALDEAWLGWHW